MSVSVPKDSFDYRVSDLGLIVTAVLYQESSGTKTNEGINRVIYVIQVKQKVDVNEALHLVNFKGC